VTALEPRDFNGPDGPSAGAFSMAPSPYRPNWWLHATLFVLTFLSTTLVGGLVWGGLPLEMAGLSLPALLTDPRVYIAGLKFSLPLLTILGCHELGHYMAARHHGLTATPPFFIPFPIPFLGIGTLGAVIRIKDPIRDKKQLLDVGAAGPVAGFAALLPFLAYGIVASEIGDSPTEGAYLEFGEPLIYRILEVALRPGLGDDMTLWLHPTGVAAWFGILVTLLNMLPFAQLDGGHVLYSLFGRLHRALVWPMLGALAGLGFVWPGWWLWVVIALILRPQHPRLWDEDLPLDPRRRMVGWIAIAIFVLCFVAEPIRIVF
jgi:membrane-associated protease RseP (regulator of RpoE activity)